MVGRRWPAGLALSAFGALAVLVVAVLVVAGCGPGTDSTSNQLLWVEERVWVRSPVGWVQAVEVGAGRTASVPTEGLTFRALAIPIGHLTDTESARVTPGETPSLGLRVGGDPEVSIAISEATPIDLDLGSARHLEVVATGGVALVRPRFLVPGTRGRRMVLVVADTLRADHANRGHMPQLFDGFAGGQRFENAFSPAAWTLPAVASLFSGERPPRLRAPDGSLIALAEGRATLAHQIAEQGWMPVAVVANETVNHENGFSQGFEVFEVPAPRDAGRQVYDAPWLVERVGRLVEWFDDQDLFLYLQPMDVHDPYHDRSTGARLVAPKSGNTLEPDALAALRAAYASEVRFLDQHLGPWLAGLAGVETAVFTADHGEELFDHGGFRHGPTLVDEVVRVPLWVAGEGIPSEQISQPVSLTGLHRFLIDRAAGRPTGLDTWVTEGGVASETFTFGPPRFSTVVGETRPIALGRPLEPGEPKHPIEAWLRRTQPPLSQATDPSRPIDAPDAVVGEHLLRALVEHYRGYRPGYFVALDPGTSLTLEIHGAAADGWFWGRGSATAERRQPDQALDLELYAEEPFLLAFVPALDGDVGSMALAIEGEPVDSGRTSDLPGVDLWLDPGRPPEELAGQAQTLERLRALGYL